jgi:hypothetical protein
MTPQLSPTLLLVISLAHVSLCMSSGTGSSVSNVVLVLLFHHHLCLGCPSTPVLPSAGQEPIIMFQDTLALYPSVLADMFLLHFSISHLVLHHGLLLLW